MPAPTTSPDQRIAGARRRIAHLASLADKTDTTERAILAAATDRLEAVQAGLVTVRPRVDLDPAAADRYRALTLERGQLEGVIASAKQAIG